jgi:two-component system response regulator NreC
VLDLMMPGRSSLDVLDELHRTELGTHVVMLTMSEDPAFARAAITAGCSAYVLKESSDTELVEAIRRAVAGLSYLDPTIGAEVATSNAPGGASALSGREREVLRLIALGNTNVEIADALSLSVRTVETHRAHIQRKTGSKTRAELVASAVGAGLLDPVLRVQRPIATTTNEG